MNIGGIPTPRRDMGASGSMSSLANAVSMVQIG